MKLRTLLTFCFLTVILLLGVGVGVLSEVGMDRLAQANLNLAQQSAREVSELTGNLARQEMVRLLENGLRRQVRSSSRQLGILLAGRDTTDPEQLRSNAEVLGLIRQNIRNPRDELCGGFFLFDQQLRLVVSGISPHWANGNALPPDEELKVIAEAQAGLTNGLISEYIVVQKPEGKRRSLLIMASQVPGTALVVAAEVDTLLYVEPMQQRIREFQEGTFQSIRTQLGQETALAQWQLRIFLIVGLGTLILVTVFFMFRFVSAVVRPLMKVQAAVEQVGRGHFDLKVPLTGTAEVRTLARTVNELGSRLRQYMENLSREVAAREAVETELHAAGTIQQSMLPKDNPPFLSDMPVGLCGINRATSQVGGDLYDYFPLSDGRLAVLIGDVSGKGMTAALFMSMVRMVLRTTCARWLDPAQALREANDLLCRDNETGLYVTLFLVYYDPATGRGRFANAGHIPPVLVRSGGDLCRLEEPHGTVLGAVAESQFPLGSLELAPGDILHLFTDGVIEARRGSEFFGEQRLEEYLHQWRDLPAGELCRRIVETVEAFQVHHQHDDITLVLLKRSEDARS